LLAKKLLDEHGLTADVWIDEPGDLSRALFGDLPHPAIVIDAAGKIRVKMSWCEPEPLGRIVPELLAEQRQQRVVPADVGFLQALAAKPAADLGAEQAAHHRWTMLAALALQQPSHADRPTWLAELARSGPQQQRDWAARMLAAPADAAPQPQRPHDPAPPTPADAGASERHRERT
jgi:hypothetical protein